MNKLITKYNRLVKQTHKFVPRRKHQILVEFHRLRLEELGNIEGIDERGKRFEGLFEKAAKSQNPNVEKKIAEMWWADEAARLSYFFPVYERLLENCGRGTWLPNKLAESFDIRAKEGVAEIKRIKEKALKLK